jgi:hypothetical protein
MSDDVFVAVVSFDLEVSMRRGEPRIAYLDDDDLAIFNVKQAGRFFAAMAGVTLDSKCHGYSIAVYDPHAGRGWSRGLVTTAFPVAAF